MENIILNKITSTIFIVLVVSSFIGSFTFAEEDLDTKWRIENTIKDMEIDGDYILSYVEANGRYPLTLAEAGCPFDKDRFGNDIYWCPWSLKLISPGPDGFLGTPVRGVNYNVGSQGTTEEELNNLFGIEEGADDADDLVIYIGSHRLFKVFFENE